MVNNPYFDVAGQAVSKHACEVLKLEMTANAALAAGCFWQVHDFTAKNGATTAPAEGSVPIKSWPASAGAADYKEFKRGELRLRNGLYICISTTEATKTLGTGNNKFSSLFVERIEPDRFSGASATVSSAGAFTMQVWSEATGLANAQKLIRVHVVNKCAAARWLMLFAYDAPADGDKPLAIWPMAANGDAAGGDILDLRFGEGRVINDNSGASASLGRRQGCTFKLSTTNYVLTLDATLGMDGYAERLSS